MKRPASRIQFTLLLIFVFVVPTVLFGFFRMEVNSFEQKSAAQHIGFDSLRNLYGKNKILPEGYERQALLALAHYPELKDVCIEFRILETAVPLASQPTVLSTLFRRASKRHYLVLISTRSKGWLGEILLQKLPFEAQVGVLGHELAHTADFVDRSFFGMMRVMFGNLSSSYLDTFEYETDQRAIDHGLGCDLLQWSIFTSGKVPASLSNGVERYMNPETIVKILKARGEQCAGE